MFLEQIEPDTQHTEPAESQVLPTMADLVALEDELDTIDATLAELQD